MVDVSVVKRDGSIVDYDGRKLRASVIAAAKSTRTPVGEAEITADRVCKHTERWLSKKTEVTSADLRRKTAEALLAFNPDAAYIYKQEKTIA
ncbi:hypothetical protein CYG49_03665 [Candidatus Saccharibacteria bacterium]|nr:MAG: hypothetical protein CYG49_03665 [Candidatus Saccharibacteria bacterium]